MEKTSLNSSPVDQKTEIKPITTDVVVSTKKKSEFGKILGSFIATDAKDISANLFTRVVVPGVQKLIMDATNNAVYWLFHGTNSNSNYNNRNSYGTGIGYNISSYTNPAGPIQQIPDNLYKRGSGNDFKNIGIRDYAKAYEIITALQDWGRQYHKVQVGAFYQMVGVQPTSIDWDWGWLEQDLQGIMPRLEGDVYYITFPKCRNIK